MFILDYVIYRIVAVILEILIDIIEQKYWFRRSAFALSSYTNSPDDPSYKGGIV
jgi:hypothetical protein